MAKKIKFPLEMKNGVKVRTLEELKNNFDVEKVLGYLLDGKLINWLKDRRYIKEANEIEKLDINSELLTKKLGEIFKIDLQDKKLDIKKIKERNNKIHLLRQYINNNEIINNIDSVALNQEELDKLINENRQVIYIFQEHLDDKSNFFEIGKDIKNIRFIGINKPKLKIFNIYKNTKNEDIKTELKKNRVEFIDVDIIIEIPDIGKCLSIMLDKIHLFTENFHGFE